MVLFEDGLEKIKNPNDVNIIKPAPTQTGLIALFARINNGEAIQLSLPQGESTFSVEPIYYLSKAMSSLYWSDFAIIRSEMAINKTHLTRLCYVDMNKKRVMTYACFDDGKIIKLYNPTRKYFFKKFKVEIEQECEMEFEDITNEVIANAKNDTDELIN